MRRRRSRRGSRSRRCYYKVRGRYMTAKSARKARRGRRKRRH